MKSDLKFAPMKDYINRKIEDTIIDASRYFPVICVTGPRQSGKSTLIKHLFPSFNAYSMEDLNVLEYAKKDPIAFLNKSTDGIIIDEVQKAPELLSYIQGIVDNDNKRKFIISGSSNFSLMKSVSQSLAGRVGVFELLPLSLSELNGICKSNDVDHQLFDGFYPAIQAGKMIPEYFYPSYVKTYLDRDVRNLVNVQDLSQFHTFIRLCAGRIGSLFNASEIGNEIGVTSNTVTKWLSVLETSYIIFKLQPWSENNGKRLTKTPKIYFHDVGLACYLLGIESHDQLFSHNMRGHLFENLVISEAIKSRYNKGKDSNLYFYRDGKQNEIDLMTVYGDKLNAYEIKSSKTYNNSFCKTLDKINSLIKTEILSKSIVYAGDFENTAGDIRLINYKNVRW